MHIRNVPHPETYVAESITIIIKLHFMVLIVSIFIAGLYLEMVLGKGICTSVITLSLKLWEYLAVIGQSYVTLYNKLDRSFTTNPSPHCIRYNLLTEHVHIKNEISLSIGVE